MRWTTRSASADKVVNQDNRGQRLPIIRVGDRVVEVDEDIDPTAVVYESDAPTSMVAPDLQCDGPDSDQVTLDPDTGEVRLNHSPDYFAEVRSSYEITVSVSDGPSDSVDLSINVNEAEFVYPAAFMSC